MTPDSSTTAYMTPYDLFTRKDIRSIAQYASDDPLNPAGSQPNPDYPAPGQPQWVVVPSLLAADPNVNAAINSACGELESACLRANIYQVADLQSLNGVSLEYMKKILSDITMYNLCIRRPGPNPAESVIESYNKAMAALTDLSSGTKIFGFVETQESGLPITKPFLPQDYYRNNLVTARWGRFWGSRQDLRRW